MPSASMARRGYVFTTDGAESESLFVPTDGSKDIMTMSDGSDEVWTVGARIMRALPVRGADRIADTLAQCKLPDPDTMLDLFERITTEWELIDQIQYPGKRTWIKKP